ncbi:MAG: hypothetical protein K2R98_32635 [Gemmataceae bacterium]|nr:hypothetical protein [Gemmataceae bacterium]
MRNAQLPPNAQARYSWRSGAALLPMLLACGCASMNNTEKGVAAGGLLGAGTGALIGSATKHTGLGAIAGAGIGALSGGLIGNAVDKSEAKTQAQIAQVSAQQQAQVQQQQVGITDVVRMVQQHIADELIINQIRTSGSIFRLSSEDINFLKSNGVSDAVVIEMQTTATRAPRYVYTSAPVYASPTVVRPVYVYEPPPPSIGVGFGWSSGGRCP